MGGRHAYCRDPRCLSGLRHDSGRSSSIQIARQDRYVRLAPCVLSQREKVTGRAFDRQIGSTKRGARYADCRIMTGVAFEPPICYPTGDRKWSSGVSRATRFQPITTPVVELKPADVSGLGSRKTLRYIESVERAVWSQRCRLVSIVRACLVTVVLAGFTAVVYGQEKAVDLELVLAVDISVSVSPAEFALQRRGLAEAYRDPAVHTAIETAGGNGIAVALLYWSGPQASRFTPIGPVG